MQGASLKTALVLEKHQLHYPSAGRDLILPLFQEEMDFFFSGCYCLVDEGEMNIELCLCHRRNELQFSVPLTLAALHSPGEVQSPFCPQENPAGIHGFKHMEEEGLGTGCDPV